MSSATSDMYKITCTKNPEQGGNQWSAICSISVIEDLLNQLRQYKQEYEPQAPFPRKRVVSMFGLPLSPEEEEVRGKELQQWLEDVLTHFEDLAPEVQEEIKKLFSYLEPVPNEEPPATEDTVGEPPEQESNEKTEAEATEVAPKEEGPREEEKHPEPLEEDITPPVIEEYKQALSENNAMEVSYLENGVRVLKHYPDRARSIKPKDKHMVLTCGEAPEFSLYFTLKQRPTAAKGKTLHLRSVTEYSLGHSGLANDSTVKDRVVTLYSEAYTMSVEFGNKETAQKFMATMKYLHFCARHGVDAKLNR